MVYCRSQRDRQNAAAVGHIQLIRRGQAKEMKEIEYDCSSSPSNESLIGRDPMWAIVVFRTERRLYSLDDQLAPAETKDRLVSQVLVGLVRERETYSPRVIAHRGSPNKALLF